MMPTPTDISDAGQRHTLDELLRAADAAGPAGLQAEAAREALASEGLQQLGEVVQRVTLAQDLTEALELLTAAITTETVAAWAMAMHLHRPEVAKQLMSLRGRRGMAHAADELKKMVEDALPSAARPKDDHLREIGKPELVAPAGYDVGGGGVYMRGGEKGDTRLCPTPMVVANVARDINTGFELLEVSWKRRGIWVSAMVDRDEALDARRLVRLAKQGAPISSANATAVVRYLQAFEAANMHAYSDPKTANRMGWSGSTFVLPDPELCSGVVLRRDEGFSSITDAVRRRGSWEGWCEVIERFVAPRPSAMLGLYAGVCTPLLSVLRSPGFVVDWSGETSLGKTTTLRVAASVWGDPDDKGKGLVLSWLSSSDVGPTTLAWYLQSIPLILDDTKRAKDADIVGRIMYDIPSGQARMKGRRDGGLQASLSWRTCLLSTGEAPITSFKPDAGAIARCLCLRGSPLGGDSPDNREVSKAIAYGLATHHGWLGPMFVEHMRTVSGDVLRRRFVELEGLFADEASTAVEGRLASYVAVLELARQLCAEIGVPHAQDMEPIEVARRAARSGSVESDRPREALEAIIRWCGSNQQRFWGRHAFVDREMTVPKEPPGGWAGRWDKPSTTRPDPWLCVNPDLARSLLDGWGYDVAGVMDAWTRRGWLVTQNDRAQGRGQRKVRVDGAAVWLLAFDPQAVASVV